MLPSSTIFWLGGFGTFFLKYREQIVTRLVNWNVRQPTKFILLGYTTVLTEEFIVALVHALSEGLSLLRFGQLVLQFWAFNIFAFTGFIVGWCFLFRRFRYSATGLFLIVGAWGLFSEHTLTYLRTNTLVAIFLILPTMSTYNLIIAPPIASIDEFGKEMNPWGKPLFLLDTLGLFSYSGVTTRLA